MMIEYVSLYRKSLDDKESELLTQGMKKRSSSETSIKNSIEYEGSPAQHSNLSTAKMPKLEIRTPFIFPPESRPRWDGDISGYQSDTTEPPLRTFSFSAIPKKSGVTQHNVGGEGQSQPTRRSRSSENLLDGGSDTKPKSPFSFSLTTPTSLLSSFKFLETKSRTNSPPSASSKSLRTQSESSSSLSKAELQYKFSSNSSNFYTSQRSTPSKVLQSGDIHVTATDFTPQRSVQSNRLQTSDRNGSEFTQQRKTQLNRLQTVSADRVATERRTTTINRLQDSEHRVQKENIYVPNQSVDKGFTALSDNSAGEQLVRSPEESQSFTQRSTDNPFLRNSKLRKSIEKILPDSPFVRDSEGRRSFGKSERPFVRNSSARKSLERTQNESPFLNEFGVSRNQGPLHQYEERYVRPGVEKRKGSLESEL